MKKLKEILSLILVFQIIISLPFAVNAEEASNPCGESLTWDLTDGVLTISGTGEMYDWTINSLPEWKGNSVTSVIIEDGVTSIGDYAFYDCKNLLSADISDTVASIGAFAFSDCIGLESVSLPDGITSIEASVFSDCWALEEIIIPDSVTSIGRFAFNNCRVLTSITIPDNVTYIGENALAYCYGLTEINIPKNVSVIEQAAFIGNSNCENFVVDEENEWYSSSDGCLFNKDKTALLAYPMAKSGTAYVMPNSVVTVVPYAFWCNSNITSYTLSENLEDIGSYSFFSVAATEITLYNKIKRIDIYAFPMSLAEVSTYYYGTEEQWDEIDIGEGNYIFTDYPLHFMGEPEEADDVFVFKLNEKNVYYAKEKVCYTVDAPCVYVGLKTYLPLRAVASASGITDLKYDAATGFITFTGLDGYGVKMTVDSAVCEITAIDGSKMNVTISAPVMINGVTYLSIRDTASLTGGSIKYNNEGYVLVSENAIDDTRVSEHIAAFEASVA